MKEKIQKGIYIHHPPSGSLLFSLPSTSQASVPTRIFWGKRQSSCMIYFRRAQTKLGVSLGNIYGTTFCSAGINTNLKSLLIFVRAEFMIPSIHFYFHFHFSVSPMRIRRSTNQAVVTSMLTILKSQRCRCPRSRRPPVRRREMAVVAVRAAAADPLRAEEAAAPVVVEASPVLLEAQFWAFAHVREPTV